MALFHVAVIALISCVNCEDLISSPVNFECSKSADCDLLAQNATCFDTSLPYNSVSFAFSGAQNVWNTKIQLDKWVALKSVPKCWAVVQPLLCAVYFPKCENGQISKVSHQLCKVAQNPCRIVTNDKEKGWPPFLHCNNATVFTNPSSNDCDSEEGNGPRKLLNNFKSSGVCMAPYFRHTTEPLAFYRDIDECGLSCHDNLYTEDEHNLLRWWKRILFGTGIFTGIFLFLTLMARKSPKASSTEHVLNQILLYMQLCYVLVCIGVLVQFSSEIDNNDVVCRSDGTRRISEPKAGHNYTCAFVFSLVYFGEFAFSLWLIFFMYVFSVSIKTSASAKESLSHYKTYFHMGAWIFPAIFTVAAFFVNAIDGFSLSGICHISMHTQSVDYGSTPNMKLVGAFILMPQCIIIAISVLVYAKLFVDLRNLSKNTPSENSGPIRKKMFRIGICVIPSILSKFVSALLSTYVAINTQIWDDSRHDFLLCKIWKNECDIKEKQNVLTVHLQMFCLFLPGFLTCVLITFDQVKSTWFEFLDRICLQLCQPRERESGKNAPKNQPRIKKHELIRKAYAKRQDFEETGRLSVSVDNETSHVNPIIGLDSKLKDPGISESEGFSETWVNALPRLVCRRNALDYGKTEKGLVRATSIDSLASISRASSIRIKTSSCVYDSKRHSIAGGESQFSLQQSELDYLENLFQSSKKKQRRSKHNFFKRHGFGSKKFRRSISSRRSSFTSQDSLSAITLDARKLQVAFGEKPSTQEGNEYVELKQKLSQLVNASMTSAENKVSINIGQASEAKAIQTSLSDLSGLGKRPPMQDAAIQCTMVPSIDCGTTTTSSSQTEDKALLKYPIDAHVTQIRVHHDGSSGDSSSIPSSYDYDKTTRKILPDFPTFHSLVPQHNRGRRGGIIPPREEDVTLDELELKCQN